MARSYTIYNIYADHNAYVNKITLSVNALLSGLFIVHLLSS